jgi:drug/metabolite transporter (DMT)-like permease
MRLSAAITMTEAAPGSPPPENVPLGAALIVLAFLLVAVMSALGKAAAVSTSAIVFFQNFISLGLFLPWGLHHGAGDLKTKHPLLHGVRGLGGVLSQALMFIAILKMPLMNTVLLSNSAPLFIPLIAWLWLREKITMRIAISLAVGFVGVLLILKPGLGLLRNPAALVATAAAVCSAIALVTVNRLSSTEPTYRILFYYFLVASLLTAPFLPFRWHSPTARQWLILLGIGLCQAASQLLIILAYRYAKPGRIAPFNYSVVVFSGVIGWIVWHNRPDALALVGVLLVSGGGIFTTLKGGANTRGHFGWIGHWNAVLHRKHWEQLWQSRHSRATTSSAS